MRKEHVRTVGLGAAIAVVATLLLTVLAASLESTINGPGRRSIAEPVLWALGSGAGMALGAIVTSWMTQRAGPGALAALGGAAVSLALLIVAYNSTDLRFEDQLVGTLIVVVLPAYIGAVVLGTIAALASRLIVRRSPAVPRNWPAS